MKTNILLFSLVLMIIGFCAFILRNTTEDVTAASNTKQNVYSPPPVPSNDHLDKFYIGALSGEADYWSCQSPNNPYSQLDQLGFNLWHSYLQGSTYNSVVQKHFPTGPFGEGCHPDTLMANIDDYKSTIIGDIGNIYAHNQRRCVMTRPKIEYLCYGQRSDYRCVDVSHLEDQRLWFYTFQDRPAGWDEQDNQYDNGKWVLHCGQPQNFPNGGYAVKRLKANTEQCKNGDNWQGDAECDWFIKPSIRIDANYANNSANWGNLVCRVDVYNQNGYNQNNPALNRIKSIDLRVRNFKPDVNTQYDGSYIQKFYIGLQYYWQDTSTDTISHRAWGDKWQWFARGNHNPDHSGQDYEDNHADIQVYWYGNCDMWLDYVRVDNDVADGLLNSNSPNYIMYNQWLYDEVTQIGGHTIDGVYPILYYYIELAEFNNLPCMAYVNKKIKQYSGNHISLISILTPDNITFHVPWEDLETVWNPQFLKSEYIDSVGFTTLCSECYPLNACYGKSQNEQLFSKIPSTLPNTSGARVLGKPVSPADYDNWLEYNLNCTPSTWENSKTHTCDGKYGRPPATDIYQRDGQFRNILQTCNTLSKMADIPILFVPQAHAWYTEWEVHRELTNEELNMMADVK